MKLVKLIVLGLIAVSVNVFAELSGMVDRIDYKAREIIIDDFFYVLPRDLEVYGVNGEIETLFAVKEGMYVRYTKAAKKGSALKLLKILDAPPASNEKIKLSPRR